MMNIAYFTREFNERIAFGVAGLIFAAAVVLPNINIFC